MRPVPAALALIVCLLVALAVPTALPQEEHVRLPVPDERDGDTTGRFTGTGLAHGFNATLGFTTTNVTQNWTLVDGEPVVATVESATYTLVCHEGTAHVRFHNGTHATHPCTMLGGGARTNVTVIVGQHLPLLDTHVTIDETNSTTYALASAMEPPNPWPGFVVTLLAVVFAAATVLLAWLYLSERRISRYLVRRLFEETRGRVPKEWPEHLRRRVIARFLVGGKN